MAPYIIFVENVCFTTIIYYAVIAFYFKFCINFALHLSIHFLLQLKLLSFVYNT